MINKIYFSTLIIETQCVVHTHSTSLFKLATFQVLSNHGGSWLHTDGAALDHTLPPTPPTPATGVSVKRGPDLHRLGDWIPGRYHPRALISCT